MGLPLFSPDFSGSNILKKQKRPERSTYLIKIFSLRSLLRTLPQSGFTNTAKGLEMSTEEQLSWLLRSESIEDVNIFLLKYTRKLLRL